MKTYALKINGCHFSDAMNKYNLSKMKDFLEGKDYKLIKTGENFSEYDYIANHIDKQKTIVLFDESGDLKDMQYEGLNN